MSHGHDHDHHGHDPHDAHGHGSHGPASHAAPTAAEDDLEASSPNAFGSSERYELEDLFAGEAPENQHFIKVAGLVLLVVLLVLALAYPFTFLLP